MADSASFWTQADALLRKNLTIQKRNIKTNIQLILFPLILCLLLLAMQLFANKQWIKENECGIDTCSVPPPTAFPPLLQVPANEFRAVRTDYISYGDLPNQSCRTNGSCPVTTLITGNNRTFGQRVAGNMYTRALDVNNNNNNFSDVALYSLADVALGSELPASYTNFLELAFDDVLPLDYVLNQCPPNSQFSVPIQLGQTSLEQDVRCVQGLNLWRNSSLEINNELYKGYCTGNQDGNINEIIAAYDFSNSNENLYNVSIWYNSTYREDTGGTPICLVRVPRSVNLVSNAYLQHVLGPTVRMLFEFVKEMPKPATTLTGLLVFSSSLGPLFVTWVVLKLFPVILSSLVYEKQHRLRIIMKMHGLGDGPYWIICYAYFLAISITYMLCFVVFGSVIGLQFFTINDYSIQFAFYFLFINLQIALAFLAAVWFSNVKTATVVGYIMVFGTGLLGDLLFRFFLEDSSFPKAWLIAMELYPGFSLYRGLYELSQYSSHGNYMGTCGMRWKDLKDSSNGMGEVLIIMSIEWLVVLGVAYYIDQGVSFGRHKTNISSSAQRYSRLQGQSSKNYTVQMEKPDVFQEREKVEKILAQESGGVSSHAIICDNLKKVYPAKDGNPEKFAVRRISLALPRGECFGMLGPNGAGKTSFINMMTGLTKPSSGTAYVSEMDIRTDMNRIYTSMGVCPQHDLLWENLTGREHLLFYGRLKNLKGAALTQAVEESLKSLNLFNGGVADKKAGKYSGGMKRRLSVAISLIGDPKVVYLDEPSTGLDPASRNLLWNVVKQAKQNRAIILTTHSMEEAEHLCDRLGIFADGSLQCIGNPKELKARYGGTYVFTITTNSSHEQQVKNMVEQLSRNATKVYQLSGTLKFELPKHKIKIADVFEAVEDAKSRFTVQAWGLSDTTLEDVFIKVAREAQSFNNLS